MTSCFNFISLIISEVEHSLPIIIAVFQGTRNMLDTYFRSRDIGVPGIHH